MYYLDVNFEGDRFDMSRYLEPTTFSRDPLVSDFLIQVMLMKKEGELIVTPDMENSPELISYSLYSSTKYWWVLALYNSKIRFDEFPSGSRIAYPRREDIEEYYFTAQRKLRQEECYAKRVSGMTQA